MSTDGIEHSGSLHLPYTELERRRHLIDDNRRVRERSRALCRMAGELRVFCEEQSGMSIAQRTIAIRKRRRQLYTTDGDAISRRFGP